MEKQFTINKMTTCFLVFVMSVIFTMVSLSFSQDQSKSSLNNSTATLPKEQVKGFYNSNMRVYTGEKFELPKKINVVLKSGKKELVEVLWEPYSNVERTAKIVKVKGLIKKYNERETLTISFVDKYINLGNPELENAIAKYRGVSKVLAEDIYDIYYIELNADEVPSLKGIEKLPGLTSISFDETNENTDGYSYSQGNVRWDLQDLKKCKNLLAISVSTADEKRLREYVSVINKIGTVEVLAISYLGPYLKNLNALEGVKVNELSISGCIEDYSGLSKFSKKTKVTWDEGSTKAGLAENNKRLIAEKHKEEASRIADAIILENGISNMPNDMKIKFVHDYIINSVSYDFDGYLNDRVPEESYEAWGALVQKKAVCSGYAKTFKLFMDKLGIECYIAIGDANGYKGWERHAWNIVKTDLGYRMIDLTWDDPIYTNNSTIENSIQYDYYLLTDTQLAEKEDHRLDPSLKLPKCE